MDAIVIYFEDLVPQEVRVQAGSWVGFVSNGGQCTMILQSGYFVKFKAKLERWERVR